MTSGNVTYAHRVAFLLTHGPLPAGHEVCHVCDNPPCVNPHHLWSGTHRENLQDASRKGRLPGRRGGLSPSAKLTAGQVVEIRRRHAAGESQHALAREYGVSQVAIHFVVHRRTWAFTSDNPVPGNNP